MVFNRKADLTKDFNELIGGRKSKVTDFEFSEKNAATLKLGFDDVIKNDPVKVGHNRLFRKTDGRKSRPIQPIRKGAKIITRSKIFKGVK